MIGIYKITNKINNKSYIGQSNNINRRFSEHKKNAGSSKNPMYIDFEQYGIENFLFEIIEECKLDELDLKEQYYIKKFNTYQKGYNLTIGGGGIQSSKSYLIETIKNDELKLSIKQWLVYYYLMSICKWNGLENERHYYIYKNALNKTAASKLLSLSRTTFYTALENLKTMGIVTEEDKWYTIQIPYIYSVVDQKTLTFLLQFQKYLGVELIRVYVILSRIYQHQELEQWFNKANLISILGHNINDTSYYTQIEFYLGFFSYWKLFDFSIEKRNISIGQCKYYRINKINRINEINDFEIEVSAPVNREFVETLKKEIQQSFS